MLTAPISGFEKRFVERFWVRNSGNGTKSHFPTATERLSVTVY